MTTTPTINTHRRTVIADGPDPIDVAVGARLRGLRIAIGKTQQWLADEIGVTFQQVQKYERGFNRISASRLVHISRALGCSPASFFTDIEAPACAVASSVAAMRLAAQIDRLSATNRNAVERIVAAATDLQDNAPDVAVWVAE